MLDLLLYFQRAFLDRIMEERDCLPDLIKSVGKSSHSFNMFLASWLFLAC